MHPIHRTALIGFAGLLAAVPATQAATYTWSGDVSSNWGDADNWTITNGAAGDPVYPSRTSDTVVIPSGKSAIVNVNDAAGTLVTGTGAIFVTNGGVLTLASNPRYATITVEAGGVLNASPTAANRTNITIQLGGKMIGTSGTSTADTGGKILTVGGTWEPRDASGANYAINLPVGRVELTTGQIVLDVFANGVSEYFNVGDETRASTLNLSGMSGDTYLGGTVLLRPQGGYVPAIGDEFKLVDVVPGSSQHNLILGDGSNIILEGYTLDTSRWATEHVVTVVPEPAIASLSAVLGAGLLIRRRRPQDR